MPAALGRAATGQRLVVHHRLWRMPDLKKEFMLQCNFCHQQGNALLRRERSRRRMEGGDQAHGALRRAAVDRGPGEDSRPCWRRTGRRSTPTPRWCPRARPGRPSTGAGTTIREMPIGDSDVADARPAAAQQRPGLRRRQPAGPGLRDRPGHRQIHRLQDPAAAGRQARRPAGRAAARLPETRDLPGHPLAGGVTQGQAHLHHALVPAPPDRVRPCDQGVSRA
jgi:hypothetical protein